VVCGQKQPTKVDENIVTAKSELGPQNCSVI